MFGSGPDGTSARTRDPYTEVGCVVDSFSCRRDEKVPGAERQPGPFCVVRRRWSAPFHVQAVADQKPLTFRRPPVAVMPLSEAVGTALLRMALRICAAVAPGFEAAYRAAPPVTCGVAIDVPLYEP